VIVTKLPVCCIVILLVLNAIDCERKKNSWIYLDATMELNYYTSFGFSSIFFVLVCNIYLVCNKIYYKKLSNICIKELIKKRMVVPFVD